MFGFCWRLGSRFRVGRKWRWCWLFGRPWTGLRWWKLNYLTENYPEGKKDFLKIEAELLKKRLEIIEKEISQLEKTPG